MKKTVVFQTRLMPQRSPVSYSELDSIPFTPLSFSGATVQQLIKHTRIDKRSAKAFAAFKTKFKDTAKEALPFHAYFDGPNTQRLKRTLLFAGDKKTVITRVVIPGNRVMSDLPFSVRVYFTGELSSAPILISIRVLWKGEPFVVEKVFSVAACKKGYADITFDKTQTLPVGMAVFQVSLYNMHGSLSSFRTTVYTLPSNPFSLDLSPRDNFVTGSYSARAVKQGGNYRTTVSVTLSNGNAFAVNMGTAFTWKFWDGGVGGSLIETGTGDFGGTIRVPASGTWGGWVSFNSPPGSGIYNKFKGREDLTVEIIMTRSDGTTVTGSITARTMFKFGVNLTKVTPRDFVGQENSDLQTAIGVTRSIYERRDVTLDYDNRYIPDANAGGFEIIDSDNEVHDLWDQWSGPNTNNNIDAFITQVNIDGKYDGMDGAIPGPTSHAGRDSGVVANKSGYVDTGGQRRLNTDYLGMLMAHELGHYLGLSHTDSTNNLMLYNSSTYQTVLTYDQYRTIIRHGWMAID